MPFDDFDDDPIDGSEYLLGALLLSVIVLAALIAAWLGVAWLLRSI